MSAFAQLLAITLGVASSEMLAIKVNDDLHENKDLIRPPRYILFYLIQLIINDIKIGVWKVRVNIEGIINKQRVDISTLEYYYITIFS